MLKKTLLLIALAVLVACGAKIPSVKTLENYDDKSSSVTTINSYLIGPGDGLEVHIWKEPELSRKVNVRLDGIITLPLVGEVRAAGLTCTELRDYLKIQYRDYVQAPEISITLLNSSSRRIYLLGKVGKPGVYPLTTNMTFLEAITRAGGLSQWAETSNIRLIRKIDGTARTFLIDYEVIISGEDLSQNILLQPDDFIFIP